MDAEPFCYHRISFIRSRLEGVPPNPPNHNIDNLIKVTTHLNWNRQCGPQNDSRISVGVVWTAPGNSHPAVARRLRAGGRRRWTLPLHIRNGFHLLGAVAGEHISVLNEVKTENLKAKAKQDRIHLHPRNISRDSRVCRDNFIPKMLITSAKVFFLFLFGFCRKSIKWCFPSLRLPTSGRCYKNDDARNEIFRFAKWHFHYGFEWVSRDAPAQRRMQNTLTRRI